MKTSIYPIITALVLVLNFACKKQMDNSNTNSTTTTTTTVANGKPLPSGAVDGVTFINSGTSVIFNLYAPNKTTVSVMGDFNNWQPLAMNETPDGTRWWVEVDNINPSTEYSYQYYIDGSIKVADPYATKILDPTYDPMIPATVYPNLKAYPSGQTGIVSEFQANPTPYVWQVANFTRPAQKNLVVYEMLVRDFVATHSYQTLTDTLNYLVNLGVNAIEVMPVSEFEGNDSWGYNPNFAFALDKYYGTANAYKAFIDACHAKGIAVIQDIVLEDQFGSSPMVQMYWNATLSQPAANNPWFDQTTMHPDGVGYQLNHQSAATVYFTENVMKYWMQQFHIDGFRFDQAHGFTQTVTTTEAAWAVYDPSRVAIWTTYINYMKSLDPNFYIIMEYFAANNETSVIANLGGTIWTDLAGAAEQATMGYATNPTWDLSGIFYNSEGFTNPYGQVGYWESHDEERTMFKNETYGNSSGSYNVTSIPTGLAREQEAIAFLMSSPGPKMIWQFEELGYDISINQNGRTGDKPILWNYTTDVNRHALYGIYAKMINFKIKNPVFATTNFSYNLTGSIKTVTLNDPTNKVEIVGNFDVVPLTAQINFPNTGTWYDNFSGTSLTVTSLPYTTTLAPGEYHVYSSTPLNH